jgi:hypothetical protein
MITKRRVSLDGVQLDEIDDRIIIQGVEPQAGKDTINTVSQWGSDGSRVTGRHRDSLDINVRFALDMKRNVYDERSEVFEAIAGWAMGGGWLRTSTKPDRRIRVICAQLPAEGDPLAWTSEYTITFRAYGVPYWQQDGAGQLRLQNVSSVNTVFGVAGNVESVLEVTFENRSGGTINDWKIEAGNSKIVLAQLGLANKETLVIDHHDNGRRSVIRIRIKNTSGSHRSVLEKRTAASSNDLQVSPGDNTVKMTSGGAGDLLISCHGRFA